MPRFARLFDAAEDILDAWREALQRRDLESALQLWLDEESVSCVLPNGQRLSGHAALRAAFAKLLEARPMWIEPLEVMTHTSIGVAIFEVVEALRFTEDSTEADLYVHTTYVLMQNHAGWRFAHMHCSPALESEIVAVASTASRSHALH